MLDHFIQSLSAWIAPSAAPAEIVQQIERLWGHPLPGAYRALAHAYGGSRSPNSVFFGCRTDLAELLAFYHVAARAGEQVAPGGCGLIGFGSGRVPEVYLELASNNGRVHWGEDWGSSGCIAESFTGFLQRRSFALAHLPPDYGTSTDTVAGVARPAPDNISRLGVALGIDGVRIEPHSDRYSICAFTTAGCLLIEQWENQDCWVQVRSRSSHELAHLCARIASVLDFYNLLRSSGGRQPSGS